MTTTTDNPFRRFHSLGYARLVPIIPPDAPISPTSSLARRKDARGKAVGVKGRDGNWFGFDWLPHEADEADIERWHNMGAGVGVKTGNGLVAIDADTMNAGYARTIRDITEEHFGRTPVRVGRYPKALYLLRTSEPYRYTRVEFGDDNERVEVLSDGRQFVAHGLHPVTRTDYAWPRPLAPFDDLAVVSAAEMDAYMEALRCALPAAKPVHREAAASDATVNQAALRGELEAIRRAVLATPNTNEHFPTREHYLQIGYAIKAALPDNEPEALAIFQDWCGRWTGGTNDPWVVEADWRRMKPPYRRGAGYIFETAERTSNGAFDPSSVWFQEISEPETLFPENLSEALKKGPDIHATPYRHPEPSAIPRREWLYGNHYIRQFVSTTVAPSGVGKSSLIIVEALAMASGKPLLGVKPRGQFRVWLWNGEDPMDELERRIAAAMQHYGLTAADVGDRLFVDSGRQMEIVLATETRAGVVISVPVEAAIMSTIAANRLDVLQIDPFVSSHRVSENDNGAIDLVSKRWARIADGGRVSIELVHHVRKLNGAEITVEDGRGAVALLATSRSARAIARMTKGEASRLGLERKARRLFRFADGKNNLALPADDETCWFELASVGLGNGRVEGGLPVGGDSVGVVTRFVVEAGEGLSGLGSGADGEAERERVGALGMLLAGADWRADPRTGDAWIGAAVASVWGLDRSDPDDKRRIQVLVKRLIESGILKEVTRPDEKRRPRGFVELSTAPVGADKLSRNVLD